MRKIAIFSGKRGGFGAMLQLMEMINNDPQMELQLIASDMHLQETFGSTLTEMEARFSVTATVDMGQYDDTKLGRAMALGICVSKLAQVLSELRPDIIVLLGDRGETLAAAMCAVEMDIPIAHIQGGDISGGVDDIHRHAITKLSHYHFAQNERQRNRVVKLGEPAHHVWNSGAPYVDNLMSQDLVSDEYVREQFNIPLAHPYFIVLFHPNTYHPESSYDEMKLILNTLAKQPEYKVVIYPCSDPGYAGIINAIQEFMDAPKFITLKTIEALLFLSLLRSARAIIGNSSGGIIEAPYFNIPFILVGDRQDGREFSSNVIEVPPDGIAISKALERIDNPTFRDNMKSQSHPFGNGNACKMIFSVLGTLPLGQDIFRKRITY